MTFLQRCRFYQEQNILASLAGLSWKELATLIHVLVVAGGGPEAGGADEETQ